MATDYSLYTSDSSPRQSGHGREDTVPGSHTTTREERRRHRSHAAASSSPSATVTVSRPRKSTRKNAPQPVDNSLTELVASARAFFTSSTFRFLLGLTFIGLAVWLLVAVISFVQTGFADQSATAGAAETVMQGGAAAPEVQNAAGAQGAKIARATVADGYGIAVLVIVFWFVMLALKQFRIVRFKTVNFTIKCLIALITVSLIVGCATIAFDTVFSLGGTHGRMVNQVIIDNVGWPGAVILSILMLTMFVAICMSDVVRWAMRKRKERNERRAAIEAERIRQEELEKEAAKRREQDMLDEVNAGEHSVETAGQTEENPHEEPMEFNPDDEALTYVDEDELLQFTNKEAEQAAPDNPTGGGVPESEMIDSSMRVNVNHIDTADEDEVEDHAAALIDPRGELPDYRFPPVTLLREAEKQVSLDRDEQLANKQRIRKTLADFGIPIVGIEATVGPTVTLYEVVPEEGIRVSKIRNLSDDIARSIEAKGVRIIAPIPGKSTVGIEVPNKYPQTVSMRTVLTSRKYLESRSELPMAIGVTISNDVYETDLADMPHLLVAGATGQGKSVGLNAIIASLIYRRHPSELKFVLVDPKTVEFSLYSVLEHHYLASVEGEEAIVTDMGKVLPILSSLTIEMDDRYRLLKEAKVRNLPRYNEKFRAGQLSVKDGHRFMPYIVVIVDEYADLLMTAGKEIEKPIARLAQKARAVGIHLIVATQRPSTDVVTGMIKANFPSRIAFKTSSPIDSKTILNNTSADKLIGKGDMLIANRGEIKRVQCAFIDTPEVEAICEYISREPGYTAPYRLPDPLVGSDGEELKSNEAFDGKVDELFAEVARAVCNMDTASTSSVQRRYGLGYNRAGRIMDQLERYGIVGPAHGGKPRAVLADQRMVEEILASLGV